MRSAVEGRLGVNPNSVDKWESIAKEQGGVSGWKITERKPQVKRGSG